MLSKLHFLLFQKEAHFQELVPRILQLIQFREPLLLMTWIIQTTQVLTEGDETLLMPLHQLNASTSGQFHYSCYRAVRHSHHKFLLCLMVGDLKKHSFSPTENCPSEPGLFAGCFGIHRRNRISQDD